MKISVITVCFNSEKTIRECIESVISQDGHHYEYIIVDGRSLDGTVAIIEEYCARFPGIIRFVSEPDNGIYDAMNKGIALATGTFVGFLNADDFFSSPSIAQDIADACSRPDVDGCFGDLELVAASNTERILRHWVGGPMPKSKMALGWHPAHPTFYVKRTLILGTAGFKIHLKIAADYEMMLRLIMGSNINMTYLPKTLVKMRAGGASNGTWVNIWRANRQCLEAWTVNELKPSPLLVPGKLAWKAGQRLKSLLQIITRN
jgi:glycosyltransferase involved in cell wall biosynthesis